MEQNQSHCFSFSEVNFGLNFISDVTERHTSINIIFFLIKTPNLNIEQFFMSKMFVETVIKRDNGRRMSCKLGDISAYKQGLNTCRPGKKDSHQMSSCFNRRTI